MNKYNELRKDNKEKYEQEQKNIINKSKESASSLQEETINKKAKVNNKNKVSSGGSVDDINYLIDVDYQNKNQAIIDDKNYKLQQSKNSYEDNAYNIFLSEQKSKKDPLTTVLGLFSKIS